MSRRPARLLAVVAACVAASLPAASQAVPPTEITGKGGPVVPLKNAAMIVKRDTGYRYIAGQQDSHLTVSKVNGKVRYRDTGTRELRKIPGSCNRQRVAKGIAAVCSIPAKFGGNHKMFLEVWPRLGNDFVSGSDLPAMFRLWTLADRGRDTVIGGAGNDFVNGAQDADKARGGAGRDWIRTGLGNDRISGGLGNDQLVGVDGSDVIRGGAGDDRVGGGPGGDELWADGGRDMVACGGGRDRARIDRADRTTECESVARY